MLKKIITLLAACLCLFTLTACGNVISGKVEFEAGATDPELNITVDEPILVRDVEMVQYNKNEDGEVELVLANYPIESFDSYVNPSFPTDLTSKVFYSSIKIDGQELTEEEVESLAYSNYVDLKPVIDLPENNGAPYGLILNNSVYITASNDWQVGEIRVTYSVLDLVPGQEYKALKAEQK